MRRDRAAAPLAIVALLMVAAGGSSAALWHSSRATNAPTVQTGRAGNVRARHIEVQNDNLLDSGLETCEAVGLEALAERLGVETKPVVVARAFAAEFEPAFREGPFEGCLAALKGRTAAERE